MQIKLTSICEHLFKFIILGVFYENFFNLNAKNLQKVVDSGQKWVYDRCVNTEKGGVAMFDRVYNHQLDAKNRMRIPAKLRDELGDKYTITCGVGGCLSVFSEAQMTELKEKLSKISMFDAQAQKPLRLLLAYSWDAEEDKQGRILIPENLRKYAKLEKDVVIIKNLNCIEIWSSDVWNDYISGVDFSDLAGALDSLK